MPVPGTVVLAELREALEEVRSQGVEVHQQYAVLDARVQELIAERGKSLLDLAKHYLPDISAASIDRSFSGIREDLRAILDRRDRSQLELDGRLKRLTSERQERETKLQQLAAEVQTQTQEREHLSKQVADALSADPSFREKSTKALAEERELKENEERIAEIHRDAAEKLPAYLQSRLFQYLYRRQYGTPQYASTGLIRSGDRWVARLIDFPRARQSFEFLQSTPSLMDAEIGRRRANFESLMDEIEAIEQRAADAAGLTTQIQRVTELEGQRQRAVSTHEEFLASFRQVEGQLQELTESRGRFYDEALDRFRKFLEKTSLAVLEQQAAETAELADDDIVHRIESLTLQIEEVAPQSQRLAEERSRVDEQIGAIEFAIRRFQQASFDSERSSFDDQFRVSEQIDRLTKGVKDKDGLWESIRHAQKSEPTWLERSVAGAGKAMDHPMTQVLLYSLVQVAGSALQSAANRAVDRRKRR